MPRTKREGIFYGAVMAFTMSLFMNLFNTFLHAGVSMQSLGRALILQPVILAIVMIVESLIVRFVRAKDSAEAHALARTVCMVTGMSLAMSLIGLVLAGTTLAELPLSFASAWPINFCMAFWWQILVAGPIARMSLKILRSYRKDSELIAEDL
jgi:hypothetical protein